MTEPTTMIQELKTRILNGGMISREEALALYEAPLEELCSAARQIQLHFCQDRFDLCTIINGKSGRCPENCRFWRPVRLLFFQHRGISSAGR